MYALLLMVPQEAQSPSFLVTLVPLLLIFLVFYFFIIRPQKKREGDRKKMIEAVKKGDKILTAGGIHGTVTQVSDTWVIIQVDTNVKIRIEKSGLGSVITKD